MTTPDAPGARTAGRTRVSLLVLYTPALAECHAFYAGLGLPFDLEQHGNGPQHYAAELGDGTVFELYPATDTRQTGAVRLGLTVEAEHAEGLAPGRHLLRDPDGRTVDVEVL